MNQSLTGRTVLVTGANGGLGEQFVLQALARGAQKVYAAARSPRDWDDTRIEPLALDLDDPRSATMAAIAAPDVDLLINNAGIAPQDDTLSGPEDELRRVFETNFFGTIRVTKAFASALASNGGGAVLNILSLASWINVPTGYAASKAAMWSATNALRVELQGQGTTVIGLHVGMVDTPMTAGMDVQKTSPESVVAQAYDAVVNGSIEVLADDLTREVKSRLSMNAGEFYPWVDEQLAALAKTP